MISRLITNNNPKFQCLINAFLQAFNADYKMCRETGNLADESVSFWLVLSKLPFPLALSSQEFLWKMNNKLFGNLRDITRCTCILTKSSFHFSNTSVFSGFSVFSRPSVFDFTVPGSYETLATTSSPMSVLSACSLIASAQPTPVWVKSDIWAPFTLWDLLQLLLTFKRNVTINRNTDGHKSWRAFILNEENSDR